MSEPMRMWGTFQQHRAQQRTHQQSTDTWTALSAELLNGIASVQRGGLPIRKIIVSPDKYDILKQQVKKNMGWFSSIQPTDILMFMGIPVELDTAMAPERTRFIASRDAV